MKNFISKLFLVSFLLIIVGCENISELNKKPIREGQLFDYEAPESIIGASFNLSLDEVEKVINEYFSEPITEDFNGEFSETYTLKTGDPFYQPNKWSKTKDPLYQPSKWIEKCVTIFGKKHCVKTKNPTYHPNKWIKTKNPSYHPNQWIYTSASVNIGYKGKYKIVLSDRVTFENLDENKLKIDVPLSIDGSAGFKGELAKIGLLEKKNFDADVTFSFVIDVSFNSDWCPDVKVVSDINWLKGPRIEIIGDTWLDFNLVAKIATIGIEPEVEKALNDVIDCESIKNQLSKILIPSSIPVTEEHGGLSLNIKPIEIYEPIISYQNRDMNLLVGSKLAMEIGKSDHEQEDWSLPELTKSPKIENIIDVNLPIFVEYEELEKAINSKRTELETELNLALDNSDIVEKIELNNFEIYPSNDQIVIGIDFEIDTNFFPGPKGQIYLTSKPAISKKHVLSLTDVTLNATLENSSYEIMLGIMKEFFESKIEESSVVDLSSKIANGSAETMIKIQNQLNEINELKITILDPVLDLSDDISNHENYLIKNVRLRSGFNAKVNLLNINKDLLSE
ncbi:DUF4403 family protein [Ichthyenterobacterium sp. W332]|uniref:DUF4403 family protein n=1 Tax=Microcosmobacter mediterraneus TaxID=3075607 RepID=A0ABU2YL17_9FLAO|nr:DUF4403 family protein [Ichthyenterobacterium sp. W332]MDT0558861.1 DUF4403 family protein [Ichthyenterobacterium sp. W332]